MNPKEHIYLGALFAVCCYIWEVNWIYCLIMFFASVLIDVDHYMVYVWRTKNLSINKAFHYFADKGLEIVTSSHAAPLVLFHTIEFNIFVLMLSSIHEVFLYIFFGMVYHEVMDLTFMWEHRVTYGREHSLIRYYLKRKNE